MEENGEETGVYMSLVFKLENFKPTPLEAETKIVGK
jgi:hypothetical protein